MSVAAKPARRVPIIWLLRVGVSALVLALIFRFVPFAQVWTAMRALSPALWAAGLALFLLGFSALGIAMLGWQARRRAHQIAAS